MILFMTPKKATESIAENVREQRLLLNLTQAGLAKRSGVPVPTIRRFEQQGKISLESLVQLLMVLGTLDKFVEATKVQQDAVASIDSLLASTSVQNRKRGRKT
ncbi:MAG: helix-turn-helix transcriptional regulator [Sphaerochaetaceae bacterium]|nr:helix-turn-helix transcriptional regulator [Sphaerochaetaceae bacterium]